MNNSNWQWRICQQRWHQTSGRNCEENICKNLDLTQYYILIIIVISSGWRICQQRWQQTNGRNCEGNICKNLNLTHAALEQYFIYRYQYVSTWQ